MVLSRMFMSSLVTAALAALGYSEFLCQLSWLPGLCEVVVTEMCHDGVPKEIDRRPDKLAHRAQV